LRGETFVTRKITRGVASIALGLQDCIYVGNLNAQRDWGHAKDYVNAMWMILQQDKPEDFVIATGVTTSVREFVRRAFLEVGIRIKFIGEGIKEKAVVTGCENENYILEVGKQVVGVDPAYFRPTEVELLIGDPSKAKTMLGWEPKYDLNTLVREMVASDVKVLEKVERSFFVNIA
jgi:GDPmannose 4,6-dehydratase